MNRPLHLLLVRMAVNQAGRQLAVPQDRRDGDEVHALLDERRGEVVPEQVEVEVDLGPLCDLGVGPPE